MPMPTDGPWPPRAHKPAYRAYTDWNAWYTGDPDLLRDAYMLRGTDGQRLPPHQRVRAGQYAGGIVGTLSRWLWGSPPSPGQRDGRLHVPLPADLAATSANLLFSEPPAITYEDATVQARLEQLVEDGLHTSLLHAAEADSALGDVYLRPVIDPDVLPDRAFLSSVHADGAIPVLRHNRLVEVTFWSELERDGQEVVRFLEHHEPGSIEYAVFVGTPDHLGERASLARFAATVDFADLQDGVQLTGLPMLDVVRIPNSGPQRLWRRVPALKYHGRSDFDGNEPLFDRLDEVWTSWLRDVYLARGRIFIPEYLARSNGPGRGATFDAEQEVFTILNAMPSQGGQSQGIEFNQFEIRHEAHKATADAVVELALRHAGLSSQTLGEEGEVAVTATEVQARERQSFTTRGNRITVWRPGIAQAVELLLAVERIEFGASRVDPVRPNVEFGDSVSEAPETMARTLQLLAAADAISTEMKVRWVHPDWEDDEVKAEVTRIKGDQPAPVDVGASFGALAGNGQGEEGRQAEE